MPISTSQFALTNGVRVQIVSPDSQPQQVIVHNHEIAVTREVFIGDSAVTASSGLCAVSQAIIPITVNPGDGLWAITNDAAGATVHVLINKQD